MKLKLKRIQQDNIQTLGELTVVGESGHTLFSCKTMELGWNDNRRRVSCIPVGNYVVKRRHSEKYKQHFHILNVPNRDFILIHPANYSRQLLGCVGVGEAHIDIDKDGLKDITNSKKTMEKLLQLMPAEFVIEIS
jgi:hypothetical protein